MELFTGQTGRTAIPIHPPTAQTLHQIHSNHWLNHLKETQKHTQAHNQKSTTDQTASHSSNRSQSSRKALTLNYGKRKPDGWTRPCWAAESFLYHLINTRMDEDFFSWRPGNISVLSLGWFNHTGVTIGSNMTQNTNRTKDPNLINLLDKQPKALQQ